MKLDCDKQVKLYLVLMSLLSYVRVALLNDAYWDDNCWLMSRFATDTLSGFLDDGFKEMRRVPLGLFLYGYFGIGTLTGHSLQVLQSFNVLIYLFVPLLMYALTVELSGGNRILGAAAATALIVVPMDHSMPYLSTINYRLGLPIELLSFLLTWRAVREGKTRWGLIGFALVLDVFTQYVLIEAAVALEPVRVGMIMYALRSSPVRRRRELIPPLEAIVFLLPVVPLVIYKLKFRPYGLYQSMYAPDLQALVDVSRYRDLAKMMLFGFWRMVAAQRHEISIVGIVAATTAAVLTYTVLRGRNASVGEEAVTLESSNYRFLSAFAIAVILFQQLMFLYAGREARWGSDSSHATFMQIGSALVGGMAITFFLTRVPICRFRASICRVVLAALAATGVYFNNANIDGFVEGTAMQQEFWHKFVARFPSLPEKATFLFDTGIPSYFYTNDLDTGYDLELMLNVIYATSPDAKTLHRYTVLAPEETLNSKFDFAALRPITRMTRFGMSTIDPADTIVVAYKNGKVLVNDEILEVDPKVAYAPWVHGAPPTIPSTTTTYPLRERLLHKQ